MRETELKVRPNPIVHPSFSYNTLEKQRMDHAHKQLSSVEDSFRRAVLSNRMQIWGPLNDEITLEHVKEAKLKSLKQRRLTLQQKRIEEALSRSNA